MCRAQVQCSIVIGGKGEGTGWCEALVVCPVLFDGGLKVGIVCFLQVLCLKIVHVCVRVSAVSNGEKDECFVIEIAIGETISKPTTRVTTASQAKTSQAE